MRGIQRARWRRHQGTTPAVALVGTLVIHGAVVGAVVSAPALIRYAVPPVYRVQLVAAPQPEPEQRRAPEAVEREAERPVPIAQRQPRRTTVAKTAPPPPRQQQEREPAPRTTPETEPAPDVKPSTGADVATVKTSGVAFPYPEYLNNIVAQVHRRWNRPRGNVALRAEILFFIHRDGSVSHVQFVQRSGSFAFDLEAQGAIEASATASAFGPLPEGYQADVLPVSFFFDPAAVR